MSKYDIENILNDIKPKENKIVVIDIETYKWIKDKKYYDYIMKDRAHKGLKDPNKIKEYNNKIEQAFALDARTGKVILAGMLLDSKSDFDDVKRVKSDINENSHYLLFDGEESELLTKFWDVLSSLYNNGFRIVSKNGKRFDIPFLIKRSIINNILNPLNILNLNILINKYENYKHCDISIILDEGSLNEWSYLLNLENDEIENRGYLIGYYYENEMYELIKKKNMKDLELTYKVYMLLKHWI